MVFDIVLLMTIGEQHFVPYKQVIEATARHGFFHAEPLLLGSYQQCLEFSPRFQTTIPAALHQQGLHTERLPELREPNLA